MHDLYLSSVPAELADVTLLGDFVLVRRLPDPEVTASKLILIPDGARDKRDGNRRGVVVKVGPGDRVMAKVSRVATTENMICQNCGRHIEAAESHALSPDGKARIHHGHHGRCIDRRHPMHVVPGDEVIYARVPANDIRIDGVEYTFLHEEQHILCVIEREASMEVADAA